MFTSIAGENVVRADVALVNFVRRLRNQLPSPLLILGFDLAVSNHVAEFTGGEVKTYRTRFLDRFDRVDQVPGLAEVIFLQRSQIEDRIRIAQARRF